MMHALIIFAACSLSACIGAGALAIVAMAKPAVMVRCPDCGVSVPVEILSIPNRCHSRCPLNQEETTDEAEQTPTLGSRGRARIEAIRTSADFRAADRQALETYRRRHSAEGVFPRPVA